MSGRELQAMILIDRPGQHAVPADYGIASGQNLPFCAGAAFSLVALAVRPAGLSASWAG